MSDLVGTPEDRFSHVVPRLFPVGKTGTRAAAPDGVGETEKRTINGRES